MEKKKALEGRLLKAKRKRNKRWRGRVGEVFMP
jgi:hypothetical protein